MKFSFIYLVTGILLSCFLNGYSQDQQVELKSIKVGVYDNPPKIFINDEGQAAGIFIDVVQTIAEKENLKIEYVFGEWFQLIQLTESGAIDVMPDVAYSATRDSNLAFSIPVLNSWLEVYATKKTMIGSIQDIRDKKIGVLKGSIQETFMNSLPYKDLSNTFGLVCYDTYSASAAALKNHEVDLLVANRFFFFSELCDVEIIPTGVIFQLSDLHFAFPETKDPELQKLFNQNIAALINNPESEYYSSIQRWFIKDSKKPLPPFILGLMVSVALLFLIATIFVFLLKRQVKLKTRSLELKNQELLLANQMIEKSDRLKSIFLQNMSHEIRTPMNGIMGFLDLLRDANLNAEDKIKYIDVINESGKRLLETVNHILDISKIESGHIDVHFVEVDLSKVMEFHLNFFKAAAIRKNLDLAISEQIESEMAVVQTDGILLNSILFNLIDNAIKFTQTGNVSIGNILKNNTVVFYVKDTGAGIPLYDLESVFLPFGHSDLMITRPQEGPGLGLSIAKAYVEKMGGELWVKSEVGIGSTFSFSIPYLTAARSSSK